MGVLGSAKERPHPSRAKGRARHLPPRRKRGRRRMRWLRWVVTVTLHFSRDYGDTPLFCKTARRGYGVVTVTLHFSRDYGDTPLFCKTARRGCRVTVTLHFSVRPRAAMVLKTNSRREAEKQLFTPQRVSAMRAFAAIVCTSFFPTSTNEWALNLPPPRRRGRGRLEMRESDSGASRDHRSISQKPTIRVVVPWVPAFAGMTGNGNGG